MSRLFLFSFGQLEGIPAPFRNEGLKGVILASLLATTFITLFSGLGVAASVTKCGSDQNPIDRREGSNQFGGVEFGYESRVENYSKTARRYSWCIENFSQYLVADFRWGNNADVDQDGRYFSAFVEPGKVGWITRTDSSDIQSSARYIGFRRLNSRFWTTITAETIFNSRLGELKTWAEPLASDPIKQIQFQKTDDSIIDIVKLSHDDPKAFVALVKERKLVFQDRMVATIPTNSSTVAAIADGKYEKYDPNDFVRATIRFANFFTVNDGVVVSDIFLEVWPEIKEDSSRLKDAFKSIDGLMTLRPTRDQAYPKELMVHDRAEIGERRILRQSGTELSYVPATLTISSKLSEITFAALPLTILVSKQ
jgi:hypothetical protein